MRRLGGGARAEALREMRNIPPVAALARSRSVAGVAAGLLLFAQGSPVTAEQVMSRSAAPAPPDLQSHAVFPESSEDGAWPQLKRLISSLENLSGPVDPDDLAGLLNLNKSVFHKVKAARSLGKAPDGRSIFWNIQYENVPDNGNKIYVSLSVTRQLDIIHRKALISENIIFDISPINRSPCVSFSSIRPDLEKLNWDGHYPGFYRGVDGTNMPDHDVIYLKGNNTNILLTSIYLSKMTSCVLYIGGRINNWNDHAK